MRLVSKVVARLLSLIRNVPRSRWSVSAQCRRWLAGGHLGERRASSLKS